MGNSLHKNKKELIELVELAAKVNRATQNKMNKLLIENKTLAEENVKLKGDLAKAKDNIIAMGWALSPDRMGR